MPFARAAAVAAMPSPSGNDGQASDQDSAGRSRSNRQKGITMEDLKKQTAMRLAQEQQHGAAIPGAPPAAAVSGDTRTKRPVVTPQSLAARRNAANCTAAPREAPPPHYQRLHHHHHHHGHPPAMVHPIPNTVDATAYSHTAPHYFDHGSRNPRHRSNKSKPVSSPVVPQHSAAPFTGRYVEQRSQYIRSASAPILPANPLSSNTLQYNSTASLASHGGQSNANSKLPHGLTVHELKEMTKARLQAEAAEKMPCGSGVDRNSSSHVVELEDRDSGAYDSTQLNYSQQQFSLQGYSNDPHSLPSHVQPQPMASNSIFNGSRQPAQVSPPSPALLGFYPTGTSYNDNGYQDQNRVSGNRNRVDSYPESNWDDASVTSRNSTVASDYLGSESAFSSGVGGGFSQAGDDQSGASLGRTQSYPVGFGRSFGTQEMPSRENTPTSVPSPMSTSYFDPSNSLGQNRQRAMTLSPRPGLSLLHEDRPVFSEEELAIPSFSSSRHVRQPMPNRSRRSFSPILQHQSYTSDSIGSFGSGTSGIIGGGMYENRPRTSSAVSLPAISHTAEEFALDINGSSRRSSDIPGVRAAPIQEHAASCLAGSTGLLGSSGFYGSAGTLVQVSSVFRNDLGGIPAPPGLEHPSLAPLPRMEPLATRNGNLDGLGSTRGRASTWVAGCDMYGSSNTTGLNESSAEDTLAGDLASILKLSGAEDRPEGSRAGGMFSDISGSFLSKSNDFGRNMY